MKIAISGATGFVGSRLVERLNQEKYQIIILTRNPTFAEKIFPKLNFPQVEIVNYSQIDTNSLSQKISTCDGVVNLSGEPIAEGRWTPEKKQEILNSRKLGTEKIVSAITQANPKPQVLVNTSAIGYYGTSETATFDENSPSGNDFLSQVCQQWEAEANKVTKLNVRLVILRFGIVLGIGGALGKMITPFKLFAGGPIGSGQQWFSWIHLDDLVSLIMAALTNSSMNGVYNATAPNPVRMNDLSATMGKVMNRPSWLPVPGFALEALLGDGAKVVLEGQKVLPTRTLESGFEFVYPDLELALTEILK
ncbi:TIGR01777 family protein [Anabaena sp. FACHB-1237]|uniref:thylakoid membrane protein ThyD n=1 Tax=Anabaena sp. FACHB-1237 TaxID=2692769 RepID=UPI0016813C26|nr:TIGR01777 family oxidoreductase [Anabaena sp. FACHB-1237]MBD2137355.1 TIGR01777 family protein [Anabaena sp. FACHB-1237]